MRKVFVLTLMVMTLICGQVFARVDQSHTLLRDETNINSLVDFSLTSGTAVYSATIDTQHNAGYSAILIKEDKSGGAGDVDVSVEYSIDGSRWHLPHKIQKFADATIDTSTGIIHEDDLIVEGVQNNTYWGRGVLSIRISLVLVKTFWDFCNAV